MNFNTRMFSVIGMLMIIVAASICGQEVVTAAQVFTEPDPLSGKYPVEVTVKSPEEGSVLKKLNLDIDNVRFIVQNQSYPHVVTVYVTADEQALLTRVGLVPVIVPNRSLSAFQKYGPGSGAPDAWPTYDQWVQRMQGIEANYPNLVRLIAIGRTVQNRTIWCLKISDNPDVNENEPEFKFSSTAHGNEPVGAEMILRLAEYLTQNYGTDLTATNLVDGLETWLCPIHNPDGYVVGSRYNARGVDLNRNFPDRDTDPVDTMLGYEVENQAFMNLSYTHHFVMGANYHTGALVVNYVWDCCVNDYSPDDALFFNYSVGYASRNPMILAGGFPLGVTIGWEWYEVNGGMQDWAYNWGGEHHVTIEVSDYQSPYPVYSEMGLYWDNNRDAMLWWMGRPLTGARGIVYDATNGELLDASVIATAINKPVMTDPTVGDYHRMLLAGTYTLQASAFCHETQSAQVTVVNSEDLAVLKDFALQRSPTFSIHGEVTDLTSGQPLQATIEVVGTQLTATSGSDGIYTLPICEGNYTLRVSASLHQPVEKIVNLTGDQVLDFTLTQSPSTLIVDDDLGANYHTYYQAALTSLGVSFDTWNSTAKSSPTNAVLSGYARVIWLTGDDYLTTLSAGEQNALVDYLDNGGHLFLSGQEIASNIANSSFLQNYLHTSYIGANATVRQLSGKEFLKGNNPTISGGGGANNQHYPGDIEPLGNGISVMDYAAPMHHAAVAFQNETYRAVFFAFGFEGINNATIRTEVMRRILNVMDGIPADLSITKSDGRTAVSPGEPITYSIQVINHSNSPIWVMPISDVFPASLLNVTWTCSASTGSTCDTTGGTGDILTTVDLAANGSAVFKADATLAWTANGELVNHAYLTVPFGVVDTDLTNNTAVDIDQILAQSLYLPAVLNMR
jgi:uncharacterized repeat protein (TIGR01451 family)